MNPQPNQQKWEKMRENLREEFEELFPKDIEATLGIRPSKSHRSQALVLWAKWEMILKEAIANSRKEGIKEGKTTKSGVRQYLLGYDAGKRETIERLNIKIEEVKKRYRCAACDGAKCEHTLLCQALSKINGVLAIEGDVKFECSISIDFWREKVRKETIEEILEFVEKESGKSGKGKNMDTQGLYRSGVRAKQ